MGALNEGRPIGPVSVDVRNERREFSVLVELADAPAVSPCTAIDCELETSIHFLRNASLAGEIKAARKIRALKAIVGIGDCGRRPTT